MTRSSNLDDRPSLLSRRLLGEPVTEQHAESMVRVLSDERIYEFLSSDPPSIEWLQEHYAYLRNGKSPDGREIWLTWILWAEGVGEGAIGYVQATIREPETVHVAYVLAPAHWRQGYAREAVTALLDTVFQTYKIERAIIEMDVRNSGSVALANSLGFRFVETVNAADEYKGHVVDEHVYELTAEEWQARRESTD